MFLKDGEKWKKLYFDEKINANKCFYDFVYIFTINTTPYEKIVCFPRFGIFGTPYPLLQNMCFKSKLQFSHIKNIEFPTGLLLTEFK